MYNGCVKKDKPTRADLLASAGKTVPDVIAPNLRVLFCGINPSLYSGYTGHHFAGPGNRFWQTLYAAGFTPRPLQAYEERELLPLGYGVTNLVMRATASAADLSSAELVAGGRVLIEKVTTYRPKIVAVLGIGAYRTAFRRPGAVMGQQDEGVGEARLWVLPNPSGLNAHYKAPELAQVFREFREKIDSIRDF